MIASAPVRGRIDRGNRLVDAEPALAALQSRAGGAMGGVIAIPPLAALARLVRRLGIVVARPITVADGEIDLDLFVRASPDGDPQAGGVALAIAGWEPAAPRCPAPAAPIVRARDHARAAADWTWESDAGLALVAVSPQAEWLLGMPAEALIGKPITALFRLIDEGTGALPLLDGLAGHSRVEEQRAELRSAPRSRYRLSAHPLLDADGGFRGFRGSAVREAEAAAEPPSAEPEPPALLGGEQLGAALRRPLGRIVAQAETIAGQEAGPLRRDYADYATDIAAAARHLLALVDDLADLDAIERADFTPETDRIDLADVGRRAAALLGIRAASRGVTIERPGGGEVPARGDYRRVLQIVVNLAANALRHSPHGGVVTIAARANGAIAELVVTDRGRGIAAEDQSRVFEKFVRLPGTEGEGSGLGLYIARRLARAMRGDLALESRRGEGAAFTLSLPAA